MSAQHILERRPRAAAVAGAATSWSARTARTPFVLFTGGKGGVGKTLLCANAGVALASRGRKVLLVDLDLGLANLNVLLKLSAPRNIEDALCGRAALADCIVRGPAGVDVLPASSGTHEMGRPDSARRAELFAALARIAGDYEIILGDSAAGIGPDVLDFCTAADRVLIVTTPEPAALTDAYGLIKALHGFGEREGREVPTPELVVNSARGFEEADATASKLCRVCERFLSRSPQSAGWLPLSRAVAESARSQAPFVLERATSSSGAALARHCLERLGSRLERLCVGPRAGGAAQGVLSRGR